MNNEKYVIALNEFRNVFKDKLGGNYQEYYEDICNEQ